MCGLAGVPDLVFLQFFSDAPGRFALLVGLRPGNFAAGRGSGAFGFDEADRLVGFGGGWGGLGLGRLLLEAVAAGALELVEFAVGFVLFPAEADGAAAEAEDSVQR